MERCNGCEHEYDGICKATGMECNSIVFCDVITNKVREEMSKTPTIGKEKTEQNKQDNVNHQKGEYKTEWKIIDGFPNYEISRNCVIRNRETGRIKKQCLGKRGYLVVSLYKEGKCCLRTVHTLMARAFIANPYGLKVVNHKDGDKTNCSLENLEWVTARDNLLHARIMGLHKSDGDKKVSQYDLNGNRIDTFKSASEASRCTGINRSNICSVARRNTKYKTAGGYIWKYEE